MPSHRDDPRAHVFQRHADNPILTSYDWPYFINTVFNAGATKLATGETLLLCRVEDCSGHSHLCAARSHDGINNWRIDPKPTLLAEPEKYPDEIWGIEDPRVVWMPELEQYAICYTCYSRRGPGVSLALTKDFVSFERIGIIMSAENKDAALLPRKINGRWAMIHRPVPRSGEAHIWISYSPDLVHWGHHTLVMEARRGSWWDANKIGLSPPLIETDEGWLMIYHGSKQTPAGCLYRVGLALLDHEDPSKCLMRGNNWLMSPETEYERIGDVGDVVFPCGYTLDDDGDGLNLYYGAADTSIALATGSVSAMLDWLKHNHTVGGAAGD